MAVTVVTRTVIARPRHVPSFLWWSLRAAAQARRSPACVGLRVRISRGRTFWTLTTWEDGRSMTAFRDSGSHGAAMPRLARWASEATSAAWRTLPQLPPWEEAMARWDDARRSPEEPDRPGR